MTLSFLRHAESRANNGEDVRSPNSDLSPKGIEQAKKVSGMFDLVVCSPMARAMSTFRHSQIRCTRTVIDKLCRERLVDNPTDFLQNEDVRPESDETFWKRVHRFQDRLTAWEDVFSSVLVISHNYFLSACFNYRNLNNAEMVVLRP